MRRFYLEHIPETSSFLLPEEESKHIVRVLRMEQNDRFILLNGKGLLLEVAIEEAHPKKCLVQVIEKKEIERNAVGFHLAIAPTKNMDRMEWMVEKIVEVGATELSFLQTEHSERVNMKYDRLERVAIAAMKQANHDFLLQINPIQSFNTFIQTFPRGGIAHCMEGEKISPLTEVISGPVLIGPEGDFSKKEVELALSNGYKAVHLGNARLRTETAGLVATVLSIAKQEIQ